MSGSSPWVYKQTEAYRWTVGYFDPEGRWVADSDHGDRQKAAERVSFLNGNPDGRLHRDLDKIIEGFAEKESHAQWWAYLFEAAESEFGEAELRLVLHVIAERLYREGW